MFFKGIVLSVLVLSLSNCKKDYSNGYGGAVQERYLLPARILT